MTFDEKLAYIEEHNPELYKKVRLPIITDSEYIEGLGEMNVNILAMMLRMKTSPIFTYSEDENFLRRLKAAYWYKKYGYTGI